MPVCKSKLAKELDIDALKPGKSPQVVSHTNDKTASGWLDAMRLAASTANGPH